MAKTKKNVLTQSDSKLSKKSKSESKSASESKIESKSAIKSELKSESVSVTKTELKTASKAESKAEARRVSTFNAESRVSDSDFDGIIVKGANEHNLKNISLRIPRNKITVVTGLSGSGKSVS